MGDVRALEEAEELKLQIEDLEARNTDLEDEVIYYYYYYCYYIYFFSWTKQNAPQKRAEKQWASWSVKRRSKKRYRSENGDNDVGFHVLQRKIQSLQAEVDNAEARK